MDERASEHVRLNTGVSIAVDLYGGTIAKPDTRAMALEQYRAEPVTYATRMVVRPDIAEELVQEAAIRLLKSEQPLAPGYT